jgi:2-polyprenyl-6-methoxyphenol hydroxylase-like FAD-dependent oxidoreductase
MSTSSGQRSGGQAPPDRTVEILVVGGGPTGMTAAGDLASSGRSVAVLERWPSTNPSSRAFATMARTLEVLDARGLAEDLLAKGSTAHEVGLFRGAKVDLSHLRSRHPYVMITPQTDVDQALGRYAEEHGAVIHRGVEVVDLAQDVDGVTVTARPKDDLDPDHLVTWRADYVIGADGSRSTVRDLVGLDFPGEAVLSSVVLADVRLTAGPERRGPTLGDTADEFGFLVPFGRPDPAGGEWYRSMTWDRNHQVPDSEPVSETEVVTVLRRAMGRDVGVAEIGWHSRFHCDERQVPRYRVGRVFLAGDAAHVHSPVGGQGMNTGIQDAANLAWKLDAVLAGAPESVLDTYHSERHPIGKRVLLQSGMMLRAVRLHARPARWLRDHMAPKILSIPKVRDTVAGSFAGTELRYPAGRGASHLVGTRATEVPLAEGRVTELLRRPGFLLVREHDAMPEVDTYIAQARRTDTGPALLIRPDGYLAWAGKLHLTGGREGWRDALRRWTGTSAAPSERSAPHG